MRVLLATQKVHRRGRESWTSRRKQGARVQEVPTQAFRQVVYQPDYTIFFFMNRFLCMTVFSFSNVSLGPVQDNNNKQEVSQATTTTTILERPKHSPIRHKQALPQRHTNTSPKMARASEHILSRTSPHDVAQHRNAFENPRMVAAAQFQCSNGYRVVTHLIDVPAGSTDNFNPSGESLLHSHHKVFCRQGQILSVPGSSLPPS